jgi:hypothetical protein
MEALTRLVADSLARHGLDRPVDPRRLLWSRWFRCDSTHSLLVVPSKPGIFAVAEEVMNLGASNDHVEAAGRGHVETAALACPEQSRRGCPERSSLMSHHDPPRSMLAVLQFSEDDDMAFVLDRMFTRVNPMRARFASGRCFLRFVVIEDQDQRRSICTALNQWMINSAEKASGLPADFSSSLELAPITDRVGRTLLSDSVGSIPTPATTSQPIGNKTNVVTMPRNPDSGAAKNLHCPHPLPSGF